MIRSKDKKHETSPQIEQAMPRKIGLSARVPRKIIETRQTRKKKPSPPLEYYYYSHLERFPPINPIAILPFPSTFASTHRLHYPCNSLLCSPLLHLHFPNGLSQSKRSYFRLLTLTRVISGTSRTSKIPS